MWVRILLLNIGTVLMRNTGLEQKQERGSLLADGGRRTGTQKETNKKSDQTRSQSNKNLLGNYLKSIAFGGVIAFL